MSQIKPFPLPIAGVDVLSNETALTQGAVRSAVNVDIDRAGRFKRRDGYVRRVSTPGLHSLYYAVQRGWTLVAHNRNLTRIDPNTYAGTFLADMRSTTPVSYTEYNGNIYYTNNSVLGWVPSDSETARAVGVPTPGRPSVAPTTLGGMTAGTYGVAVSAVDDRGEESGLSDVATVKLDVTGGIALAGVTPPSGGRIYVYTTSADGDILRFAGSGTQVTDNPSGGPPSTKHLRPLPAGDFVCWHGGRLYTAEYGVLRFSEALRPHLYNPAYGAIPFSGQISFVEAVSDGMYVGDDRGVWFLAGVDPSKFELRRVSSCRAVMRSSIMLPPEHLPSDQVKTDVPVAVWLSTSGYVVGMPGGATVELQPDRIKVPSGMAGRSAFLLREGRKQVITLVNSTSTAAFGVAVDSVIS